MSFLKWLAKLCPVIETVVEDALIVRAKKALLYFSYKP